MRIRFNKIFFTCLFLIYPVFSFSQGEFNTWYFSVNAGVTFNSGVPVYLTDGFCGSAGYNVSLSDSSGSFLFSSNSIGVFNRNQDPMPNGSPLHGKSIGFFQTCFAVPDIESSN